MLNRKLQSGFTMIELMIGLVVIAILFSVGIPSFKDWIQNTQIRNAAEEIQNGLQLARSEAVRRNTPVQFVLGAGSSWSVECAVPQGGDSDLDGKADCPGVGTVPSNIQAYSSIDGSKNAEVTNTATGNAYSGIPIVFNSLGRVTPIPIAPISLSIKNGTVGGNCVAAGGTMRCLNITIATGGQIRMCDPAYALPAYPQGC